MQKNDPRSLAMLLGSMFIFGSIGIFRRYIPLPSAVLACVRGLSGALLLFVFTLLRKKKLFRHVEPRKLLGFIVSGVMIGFNWILLFEAYNYTSVATATLCYYMQPTIIIFVSPLFFREKLTARKLACALVSLAGMVLVSGLADTGLPSPAELKGILCGLGAAVLYAAVIIVNKKLPGAEPYEKTIAQLGSAGLVLVPYLLITQPVSDTPLTPFILLMTVIVCVVHTGTAYALYFGSMDGLSARTVAMGSYVDPVTALLLSALILHENLTAFGVIGAVMILGAAVVGELPERKKDAAS